MMEKQERKLLAKYLNNSGKNTIRVEVEDIKMHSKYKKYLKKTKRYLVHCIDDAVTLNQGDRVMIQSTRRISKKKSFVFLNKVEEGGK
ncbi:30S ribosomal protein S17 [bacterium]|nr:30S ribosomal protein S17 [bacterium]|tara:strand:+ start:799 stop:1062 length:264 start_codon:yes stop_codon:yes gene_type:complete